MSTVLVTIGLIAIGFLNGLIVGWYVGMHDTKKIYNKILNEKRNLE